MPGAVRTSAVLSVLAAVLLTGCAAGSGDPVAGKPTGEASASPSASPSFAATPAAPAFVPARVGQCWNATVAQASAQSWEGSGAVACTETHNAVTYAVATLPDDPTFGRAGPRTMPAAIAEKSCNYRQALAAVGHSLRSPVRVSTFWYGPTPAQYLAGARQVRCDLSVTEGTVFRKLPSRLTAAAFDGDAYQICATGSLAAGPEGDGEGSFRPCTRSLNFRLIKYVELKTRPAQPFPGTEVLAQRLQKACPMLRDGDWVTNSNKAKAWADGKTLGGCWRRLG